jgi:hypothetical protein
MSLRVGQPVLKIFSKSKAEELGVLLVNLNEALRVLSVQNEDEDWPVALVDGMFFFYYLALEG